jgi:hypothetical protein
MHRHIAEMNWKASVESMAKEGDRKNNKWNVLCVE